MGPCLLLSQSCQLETRWQIGDESDVPVEVKDGPAHGVVLLPLLAIRRGSPSPPIEDLHAQHSSSDKSFNRDPTREQHQHVISLSSTPSPAKSSP